MVPNRAPRPGRTTGAGTGLVCPAARRDESVPSGAGSSAGMGDIVGTGRDCGGRGRGERAPGSAGADSRFCLGGAWGRWAERTGGGAGERAGTGAGAATAPPPAAWARLARNSARRCCCKARSWAARCSCKARWRSAALCGFAEAWTGAGWAAISTGRPMRSSSVSWRERDWIAARRERSCCNQEANFPMPPMRPKMITNPMGLVRKFRMLPIRFPNGARSSSRRVSSRC